MRRSCMWFTNKLLLASALAAGFGLAVEVSAYAAQVEREPVTLSVVAVNPSADKVQVVPVRIDLPTEVAPKDVLGTGELSLEYDEDRKSYYVYKESVALQPKETRVFEVTVRDVWYIPQPDLDGLRKYTDMLLARLKETEYYATGKETADSIFRRLSEIQNTQNDDTLSRKSRIGSFRYHLQTIADIKEDLARMEKLLTFIGGPPVPEMLEESPLKSDAPSTTTTWLVIGMIIVFIGLLGGQFFFTWNRRVRLTREVPILKSPAGGPGHGAPKGS